MSINDLTPMKYTDVGQGNFDRMLQREFLKAHKIASEYGQKVSVVANIDIYPPDPRSPEFSNHSYSVQLKEPKYVSQKFTTKLVGGIPVSDGRTEADAMQLDVFEPVVREGLQEKMEVIDGIEHNNRQTKS